MSSTFRLDHKQMQTGNLLQARAVDLLIREAMEDIANYAQQRAVTFAPERTGNLRRGIRTTAVRKLSGYYTTSLTVSKNVPYARWVERGTGIFGPFKTPIVPKTGNVLVFKLFDRNLRPGQERTIFARSVKGQPGQRYIARAYQETDRVYTPMRLQLLKREMAEAIIRLSS